MGFMNNNSKPVSSNPAPQTPPQTGNPGDNIAKVAEMLAPMLVAKLESLFTDKTDNLRLEIAGLRADIAGLPDEIRESVTAGIVDGNRATATNPANGNATPTAPSAPAPNHVVTDDLMGGERAMLETLTKSGKGKSVLSYLDYTIDEYIAWACDGLTMMQDWHNANSGESDDAKKLADKFKGKDWNVAKMLNYGAVTLCECGAAGQAFTGGVMPDKGNLHNDHNIWLMSTTHEHIPAS